MHLINLKDGGASLEFSPGEADAVSQALARLHAKRTDTGVLHEVITIGDEQLIHYSEWDDACLIAKTLSGSKLLRRILSDFSQSKAA